MDLKIYTDGGARGNPGISGYGLVITDEFDQVVYKESKYLGIKTNNEAEYLGLLSALNWVLNNKANHKLTSLKFFSDSQLMVRQINRQYKVKAENLKPLYQSAQKLLLDIDLPYQFTDIRRHLNSLADSLANEAMDRQC